MFDKYALLASETSLLIINTDLTKEDDEMMKYTSWLRISKIILLMDYRASCQKIAQSLLDVWLLRIYFGSSLLPPYFFTDHFAVIVISLTCSGNFSPHSNTKMSTHAACYNGNNLNKWSHRPPKHAFLHIMWRWYPPNSPLTSPLLSKPATHSPSPVFLGDLPGLWGQDRTGEDKLQPQSPGSLSCFHLHQQLISHHWRALACQAEDFIRDVLYGP